MGGGRITSAPALTATPTLTLPLPLPPTPTPTPTPTATPNLQPRWAAAGLIVSASALNANKWRERSAAGGDFGGFL